MSDRIKIGQVVSCSSRTVVVVCDSLKIFEENKNSLQLGKQLVVEHGNVDFVVLTIVNINGSIRDDDQASLQWRFDVECQPIGTLVDGDKFIRSSASLPVPTEPAYIPSADCLSSIFGAVAGYDFSVGKMSSTGVPVFIDADRFFGKHVALVGSTGSGKSCAVARIIQDVVGICNCQNIYKECQKNAHIIVFDIHSEYASAFTIPGEQRFTLNSLDVDSIKLPYWLMNSEELESLFIESNEQNSHNQVSQFKRAVILNKERHNHGMSSITYDTPVYFSIKEVCNYIENVNREVISRLPGENVPKLEDGTLVTERKAHYFDRVHEFVANSSSTASRATNGPFNGEFNRFLSRLETTINDTRLEFLMNPKKDGKEYVTCDFELIVKQFLGYLNKSNITIVDLSGIPFEVLSVVVSLVTRIVFDFCFYYSKLCHSSGNLNDIPVMIVCEEAHNYAPRSKDVQYKASLKSIERVAKEGRKYGLGLMLVSQRPSEVSETIFAQCNNFVSLRLTNTGDQNYIKSLLPENDKIITDVLPNLAPGEALLVGDAVLLPVVVKLEKPVPEPQSQSVPFHSRWREDWKDVVFSQVISRWRRE